MGRASRESHRGRSEKARVPAEAEGVRGIIDRNRRRFLLGGAAVIVVGAVSTLYAILPSKDDEDGRSEPSTKPRDAGRGAVAKEQIASGLPRDNFTKVRPLNIPSDGEEFRKLIALQEHWKGISEEALGKFKNADPKVQLLIQFMQERAYYSVPKGPQVTQVIFPQNISQEDAVRRMDETMKTGFEIVYMPDRYADQMSSSIMTQNNGKTMRVATTFKCEEWLGIMLAHEMSHVYDGLVEGEIYSNPEEHLAGEVKAHLLEMRLLKAWNEEAYEHLIAKGIPLWKAGRSKDVFDLCESIYPLSSDLVSRNESGLGMGSCIIAIAFEMAMQDGMQEKDLGRVYKSVMQSSSASKK